MFIGGMNELVGDPRERDKAARARESWTDRDRDSGGRGGHNPLKSRANHRGRNGAGIAKRVGGKEDKGLPETAFTKARHRGDAQEAHSPQYF